MTAEEIVARNKEEHHQGKAMVEFDGDRMLRCTFDCTHCGRFVIMVPVDHIGAVTETLKQIAGEMGFEWKGYSQIISRVSTSDPEELGDIRDTFEDMPMAPTLDDTDETATTVSLWGD